MKFCTHLVRFFRISYAVPPLPREKLAGYKEPVFPDIKAGFAVNPQDYIKLSCNIKFERSMLYLRHAISLKNFLLSPELAQGCPPKSISEMSPGKFVLKFERRFIFQKNPKLISSFAKFYKAMACRNSEVKRFILSGTYSRCFFIDVFITQFMLNHLVIRGNV